MRANYTENIDYREVTSDDKSVQSYLDFEQNSKCLLISTYQILHNRGSKQEYLIQAIEIFCVDGGTPYEYQKDKDDTEKKITLVWKDLQAVLKQVCGVKKLLPSKWRKQLKDINADSQSIQQIQWIKKD